jgi:hypothetical protein
MSLTAGKLYERHEYGMCGEFAPPTTQNSLIGAVDGTHDSIHSTTPACPYKVTINTNHIIVNISTIYLDRHYTTQDGVSQMAGTEAFGCTYTCVAFYYAKVTALNNRYHYVAALKRRITKQNETQIISHSHYFSAYTGLRCKRHRQSPGIYPE